MKAKTPIYPWPILTIRGFVVLGFSLLGPILGVLLGLPLFVCIGISFIIVLIFCLWALGEFILVQRIISQLELKVDLAKIIFSAVPAILEIKIQGLNRDKLKQVLLRPENPVGISVINQVEQVVSTEGSEFSQINYHFLPLSRQPIQWDRFWFRLTLRAKLICWQFCYLLPESVVAKIYPNAMPAKESSQLPMSTQQLGAMTVESLAGEGKEFDSLRQYAVGDDLRRVDWKRSAKYSNLLVKVYRPETHQRVNIMLDCSRRMATLVDHRLQLDHAVDAAARLLNITETNYDEIGLFAFNHQVVTHIPCGRGKEQRGLIMESLSKLPVGAFEADYSLMQNWTQGNPRRTLIVLLTSLSTPTSFDTIYNSLRWSVNKHLPLVVGIYDRELYAITDQPAASARDAYLVAAAQQQTQKIAERVQYFKRVGIECIYADARNISELLARKYFELKLRGRL